MTPFGYIAKAVRDNAKECECPTAFIRKGRASFITAAHLVQELDKIRAHVTMHHFDEANANARFEVYDRQNKVIVCVVNCPVEVCMSYIS